MRIDNSKTKLVFEFEVGKWFLCKADEDKTGWPYSLNFRIDRSEKGKDDDVGIPKIYVDEEEAKQARNAGIVEISF